MKIKSLLLMSLVASMGFVSCNNEENGMEVPQDNRMKSVTVTLPNIANVNTRAVGDAVEGNSKVELQNFKVFFVDATGNEVDVPQFGDVDQVTFFNGENMADLTDDDGATYAYTYHFLPATVDKVIVVGNEGDCDFAKTKTNDVLNDTEEGTPLYPLYGESTLSRKDESHTVGDEEHNNVYTASVNLLPRISRFEVYGFEYALADQAQECIYDKVELQKIALNNYYTQYDLFTGAINTNVNTVLDEGNVWDWMAEAASPWADNLNNLEVAALGTKLANGSDGNQSAGEDEMTGIITYGLAGTSGTAINQQLVLTLMGVKGTAKTPLYLIGKFENKTFEPGKIYRVWYKFDDGKFNQPERCVELTVTVAEWEVVPVTPEF